MKYFVVLTMFLVGCGDVTIDSPNVDEDQVDESHTVPPFDPDVKTGGKNMCALYSSSNSAGIPIPVLCQPNTLDKGRPVEDKNYHENIWELKFNNPC